MTQSSSQLFASLLDERAHFGKGLYASQHEPAVWNSRTRILLNNYSNGDPLRDPLDAEGAQRVREWGDENRHGHRAAYCIPLIVPRDMAYNIFQRQTPDIAAKVVEDRNGETRHVRLGEDYKGRPVHSNRDVWIIRIAEAGAVGHAHASTDDVINLLERRLAKLRMSAGSLDSKTFDCLSELGHRYQSRARFDEAERLLREAFEGRLEKLGESDRGTLNSMAGLASVLQ
ncbi:Nphp3, partial [Symbiodinium necroappetens]